MRIARSMVVLVGVLTVQAAPAGGSGHETKGASSGWLDAIERKITDTEYAITWQHETAIEGLGAAWQAPNRAHGLRTYFTGNGIRVISRAEPHPSWEWAMTLVGYGTPSVGGTVELAMPRVNGNRVDYARGRIEERYVNDDRGLAQRFTLAAPPSSSRHGSQPVQLELALGGTLIPVISEDGKAIDFATAEGQKVLHYARLGVRDARGQELTARMEGFNHDGQRGIRIVFDDREAVYPVSVDVLATSAAWTAEGNQDGARFGVSVATAGDVNGDGYSDVIVGAYLYDNGQTDEGRAFVFHGSAAGLETEASWTAESDSALAGFGFSVATGGDVNGDGYSDVIVGAATYTNDQLHQGRAFVYHGSATGLLPAPAWFAQSDQAGAEFGNAVAGAGDVNGDGYSDVVIGAHLFDNGQVDEGVAFVYHGSAAGLQNTIAWTAESDQAGAELGGAVATAGDVDGNGYADVIIGARLYDSTTTDEGRVFVYHGSPAGLLISPGWKDESGQDGAQLGNSVATAGDVNGDGYSDVILGCSKFEHGQVEEGRVFVYLGSGTGLQSVAAWRAEGDQVLANFGYSVATAGDVNGDGYADIIIGASGYDNDSGDEGRAFVYLGSAAGPQRAVAWTAESNQAAAFFGSAVATAGDVNGDGYGDVIVGAPQYDRGETDEGSAFVYHGSPSGLQKAAGFTTDGNQIGAQLGVSVATAGDVNGDGYSDVVAGANFYDNGFLDEGRAFVYLGGAAGLSTAPAWTADGKQAQALFGSAVASAGDVNGDGYSDVIIGANRYDHGETDEGRVFVYHGSAEGLRTAAAWMAESDQASAFFGSAVATAGDVNGDGYSDVIVGCWAYDNGETNEGRAFVYHGSAAGLQTAAAWTAEGDQDDAIFGWSVGTAGDVNGDGYSDVIIGAILYDNDQRNEGRAVVYHGSPSGLAAREAWTAEGNQSNSNFGYTVATAGDVNGDGYADVIIGAYLYYNGLTEQGRAFSYHGSATGLLRTTSWTAETGQTSAWFGRSVASAGDVNGDGYSDVIVGAPSLDSGQEDEGRAFVYPGTPAGLQPAVSWTAESNQTGALFGTSVASAGDVNGDGYSDVIVGAPRFGDGEAYEGRIFVYYGNDGRGVGLRPQQRRVADTAPIAPLGASDGLDSFRVALLARSPFGRSRVKLEWEVKPFGETLDGFELQTTLQSRDTQTAGASFSEPVAGLIPGMLYHWRVRMRYSPVTTPFQQHSRWLRAHVAGWEEPMLRMGAATAGSIPDGTVGSPLTLGKTPGAQIALSWGASCAAMDTDYEIYEGTLGSFTSHIPRACSSDGATSATLTPVAGNSYYLIVPRNAAREGSYGKDSAGLERPAGQDVCLAQKFEACQ